MEASQQPEPQGSQPPPPAGERHRTFPCDQCGADLEFHIGVQELKCPYCGFVKPIEVAPGSKVSEQDLEAALVRIAARRGTSSVPGDLEVQCQACGGTLRFSGTVTTAECAYCATPIQRGDVHQAVERLRVDGVLPFRIARERASEELRRWVKSRWFAPGEFKRRGAHGRFEGVYTPYWTFDAATATRYVGERGDHYWVEVGSGKNRRRERRTRWTPASGSFQRFFDDVLVCATAAVAPRLVDRLQPWPLADCRPFDHGLLAGQVAMTYDIELGDGFTRARAHIDAAIETEVRRRIGGDVQRVHDISTTYGGLTYKHLLLPVWMMAYRFADRSYRVVVNACTGEVQGERPWSWIKIACAVLLALLLLALLAPLLEKR
jgi:hypothetical protein